MRTDFMRGGNNSMTYVVPNPNVVNSKDLGMGNNSTLLVVYEHVSYVPII